MSVIVLGLSHRSAPLAVLERASLDPAGQQALLERLLAGENVDEPTVLSTCNRVEVYADATTFHGAVTEIGEALAAATGVGLGELREHLYVHFDERAVAHDWLATIYEPITRTVPPQLRQKLEPAEMFHEVLEHRWYMSERLQHRVTIEEAVADYVENILPTKPDEQNVIAPDATPLQMTAR